MVQKRKTTSRTKRKRPASRKRVWRLPSPRRLIRAVAQIFLWWLVFQIAMVILFAFVNPPTNFYMASESWRLGGVRQDWVPIEDISPHMARAVVAAEDADFCQHWGFDLTAIRAVVNSGSSRVRGASTISQQVSKNVFLWPNRSWLRKLFEAETTVLVELIWSKRRIVEVYMNVAEFDEGVFGVGAAAPYYFGVSAQNLTLEQAARLAAVLPNPKGRSASKPVSATRKRVRLIRSGAETIAVDGRDACLQ